MKKRSVLLKLFFSTLYLSAFTFGGGYVIVTLMKKQFVDKYHWIEESEMLDLIAIAQSAPIVAAFNFVDTLAQVGTTVAQVDEILNAEEQVHSETPVTFSDHTVVLKDVRFGYHADQELLHGVSLTIPQNKMTALVGRSGGGKSTIAKLAAGFWDAGSGSITMGGHELKDIPLTQLYDQVAFVSQDNYLFDDTVRENIRMGRRAHRAEGYARGACRTGRHLPGFHHGAAAGRRLEAVNQKAQAGAYVLPDFLCGAGKRAKTDPASRPDRSPRARAAGAPAL